MVNEHNTVIISGTHNTFRLKSLVVFEKLKIIQIVAESITQKLTLYSYTKLVIFNYLSFVLV